MTYSFAVEGGQSSCPISDDFAACAVLTWSGHDATFVKGQGLRTLAAVNDRQKLLVKVPAGSATTSARWPAAHTSLAGVDVARVA